MNDERIHIRDMNDGDIEAVQDVTVSAYMEYSAVMPPFIWEEYRSSMLATIASNEPPMDKIVAEQGGRIVGSVMLIPAGTVFQGPDEEEYAFPSPEVRLLAVQPQSRGLGVGTLLLEECIKRARESEAASITLHTLDIMKIAMQMYERRGFVHVPELDFHPAPEVVIKGYRLEL